MTARARQSSEIASGHRVASNLGVGVVQTIEGWFGLIYVQDVIIQQTGPFQDAQEALTQASEVINNVCRELIPDYPKNAYNSPPAQLVKSKEKEGAA